MSKIEWTDETWNPLTGCTRVSTGCDNCYAARQAAGRLKNTPAYEGLAVITKGGRAAFNGRIRLLPERLDQPLRWRKPRRVFVNSMSDLFHEGVPYEFLDQAFAVMALTPQHTYQVLTKRPERMYAYCNDVSQGRRDGRGNAVLGLGGLTDGLPWPLPNVWLGTSVEDQAAAEQRIKWLVETPAAVRFLSCEPLLGPVDLTRIEVVAPRPPNGPGVWVNALTGHFIGPDDMTDLRVQWVVIGGESGPRARPFDVAWARSLVKQCRDAEVPAFVKQLGACPVEERPGHGPTGRFRTGPNGNRQFERTVSRLRLGDPKGGDWREWPHDLQIRMWPS